MAFNKKETEVDMDQIAAFLQDAVEKVKTQENPDLLNDLKKVFKKNVPFSLRGYVAAYLAKQSGSHFHYRRDFNNNRRENRREFNNNRRENRTERPARAERTAGETAENTEFTPRQRVQIDEALATTIFIGIGRNRRVYPRDLVGLLVSVAGLDRDRIGDIRVLANYSFVQLFTEDTDTAISKLNGYEYRGRKLSVSYSRLKDEAAESEENAAGYTDSDAQADAQAYAAAEKAASNQEGFSSGNAVPSDSNYLV